MKRPAACALAVSLLLAALVCCGCEDTTQNPADGDSAVNPDKPNANDLVIGEAVIGDPGEKSSIWAIIDAGDGGFYFRGYYHGRYAVGKLGSAGQSVWLARSQYSVRDIVRMDELTGPLRDALVSVGGYDKNLDDMVDVGYLSVYGNGGGPVGEIVCTNDTADVWLNAMDVLGTDAGVYHFLAVGGAAIGETGYPYLVEIDVEGDSTVVKRGEYILMDMAGLYLGDIIVHAGGTGTVVYCVGSKYPPAVDVRHQVVCKLTHTYAHEWSADIEPVAGHESQYNTGQASFLASPAIYFAGYTDYPKETDPPEGYWDAGCIASISTGGQVSWLETVVLSKHSERYNECCLHGTDLLAAGKYAGYGLKESDRQFGYGLLSVLDPATGDIESNLSFGDERYLSSFNTIIVRDSRVFAAGYTNEATSDSYQGWFVEIDLSAAALVDGIRPGTGRDLPYPVCEPREAREVSGGL